MRTNVRHLGLLLVCATVLCGGCAAHRVAGVPTAQAPVVTAEAIREHQPDDFLRIAFVPAGVTVTSVARPGAIRGFATATALFTPGLKLKAVPFYSGLQNEDGQTLVAMRCRPADPQKTDAVLATWPNVFAAIQRDAAALVSCSPSPAGAADQAVCFAKGFSDAPASTVPSSLANVFQYAAEIYDDKHVALAGWLQKMYGIFPAFSGMGYSVKDSYHLDREPMSSQQVLSKSLSSEFLLKNVTLAEAGCRCIAVPPYPGRAEDSVDPAFIESAGGAGVCKEVIRLPTPR